MRNARISKKYYTKNTKNTFFNIIYVIYVISKHIYYRITLRISNKIQYR